MTKYENKFIGVNKESLEVLILNYIFSNLDRGKNRVRFAGDAFCKISISAEGSSVVGIEYKVFTEYLFDDGEKENYHDTVQIIIEGNCDYTKEDINRLKTDMYLNSINDVAFIVNLIKNIKF